MKKTFTAFKAWIQGRGPQNAMRRLIVARAGKGAYASRCPRCGGPMEGPVHSSQVDVIICGTCGVEETYGKEFSEWVMPLDMWAVIENPSGREHPFFDTKE